MPEYLPFRIETDERGGTAHIAGRFEINPDLVPNLEDVRKEYLADLQASLLAKGLPEPLKVRRDQLSALVNDLSTQVEGAKASIHRCADDRDGLWQSGQIPSVDALEKADAAVDAAKLRFANLLAHLDGARARMDDLHREIAEQAKRDARAAIKEAVQFAPSEQKSVDALLAIFTDPKRSESLVRACVKQRLAWDFGEKNAGTWIGSVDAVSGMVAHKLLNPPVIHAEDGDDQIDAEATEAEVVVTA